MTSCAKESSSPTIVISPTLHSYSQKFRDNAVEERKHMAAPCDRLEPVEPCSANKRLVNDFRDVRKEIRKGKKTK